MVSPRVLTFGFPSNTKWGVRRKIGFKPVMSGIGPTVTVLECHSPPGFDNRPGHAGL